MNLQDVKINDVLFSKKNNCLVTVEAITGNQITCSWSDGSGQNQEVLDATDLSFEDLSVPSKPEPAVKTPQPEPAVEKVAEPLVQEKTPLTDAYTLRDKLNSLVEKANNLILLQSKNGAITSPIAKSENDVRIENLQKLIAKEISEL
jgi:hypothetical protein